MVQAQNAGLTVIIAVVSYACLNADTIQNTQNTWTDPTLRLNS